MKNSASSIPRSVHRASSSRGANRTSQRVAAIARSASDVSSALANTSARRRAAGPRARRATLQIVGSRAAASAASSSAARSVACSRSCSSRRSARAWSITSSSVGPCFFFRRSSSARRSSTSCSRAGEASMPPRTTQEEREILELRLDAVARVEVRREARVERARARRPCFQTVAERRQRGLVAFVERVVGLAAEPLEPVGVGEDLPRRGRARRPRPACGATRSISASWKARTRRATPSRCSAWREPLALVAQLLPCGERVRHRGASGVSAANSSSRSRCVGRIEQHLMLVLAVQLDEPPTRSRSAALVASAPSTNARLRPCAEISRRTISLASVRRFEDRLNRRERPRRCARGRPTRGRRPAGRRLRRGSTCRRRFRRSGRSSPGSNSSSRRSMTARWRMLRKRSMACARL